MITAGKLRKIIQLWSRNAAQDTFGQAAAYTQYASVHASIEAMQATEVYKAQQYTSEVSHIVTIRYQTGFTPKSKDRVMYGTRTFDIKAVVNTDERNYEWKLLCLELADGAAAGA